MDKHPHLTRTGSLCLGVAAAIVLAALSLINLEGQGASYDELHQAPAAFNYLGGQSPTFNYDFRGIPILNMSYSGAIKSNIYGFYLRYVTPHFTIYSWRLFGIVFLAIGLVVFYLVAGVSLSLSNAILFGALFLTDASIILMNRHDFGPVALALCFRLGLIGAWMSIVNKPADAKFFIAGFVVGIAIFEKLSSVVLLAPLCLLLLTVRRPRAHSWIASAFGLLMGSLPLILANIGYYALGHGFVSLSELSTGPVDRLSVLDYTYQYLALGQGDMARRLILGELSNPFWKQAEAMMMGTVLLIIVVAALRLRPLDRLMALSALMVSSYVAVGIALYMLPRDTFVHHWMLGTPFQYAAIALALAGFANAAQQEKKERMIYRVVFIAVVIGLLAIRIPNIAAVEVSLASGKASDRFHPALTRLGEIAASRSNDAAFIAADWGTATQVYCLGDGQEDLIYEPFWDIDPGKTTLEIAETTKKNTLYTLVTGIAPQFQEASSSILLSMMSLTNWQEVPVEKELAELPLVQVRKFVRRTIG